jgi:hypothetical protein
MKNERDITIKVIHNNTINNRKLTEYFAKKYMIERIKIQTQKS